MTSDARAALTKADVMEGVADLIPMVPTAARSTSCVTRTRLVGSAGSTSATFPTALPIATCVYRKPQPVEGEGESRKLIG